jgi:hypothetical protein
MTVIPRKYFGPMRNTIRRLFEKETTGYSWNLPRAALDTKADEKALR